MSRNVRRKALGLSLFFAMATIDPAHAPSKDILFTKERPVATFPQITCENFEPICTQTP
jgi:hypothetical protein